MPTTFQTCRQHFSMWEPSRFFDQKLSPLLKSSRKPMFPSSYICGREHSTASILTYPEAQVSRETMRARENWLLRLLRSIHHDEASFSEAGELAPLLRFKGADLGWEEASVGFGVDGVGFAGDCEAEDSKAPVLIIVMGLLRRSCRWRGRGRRLRMWSSSLRFCGMCPRCRRRGGVWVRRCLSRWG